MLPIAIATIVESTFKQLPQVDLTFGIGDIVGSIALLVSAFTFYISYTRASQSEQIRTTRDIWAGIIEKVDKFVKERERIKELREIEEQEHLAHQQKYDEFEKAGEGTKEFKGPPLPPPFLFEFLRAALPVIMEIDYFAYLILNDEIKDKVVLGYYKEQLTILIGGMLVSSDYTDLREQWSRMYPPLR